MLRRSTLLVGSLVLFAACGAPSSERATSPSGSMQSRWWTWVASAPAASSPVTDKTGEFCDRDQPPDIWFLAGTLGGEVHRHCAVPGGRSIVVPVVNLYSGSAKDCVGFMAVADGKVELDGKAIPLERIEREQIQFRAVTGNALGQSAGTFTATACGLWARIGPLAAGPHTLRIRGESGNFTVDVAYDLDIAAPTG